MRIEAAKKSLVVRMAVQPASIRARVEDIEPVMREGLEAAKLLLDWYTTCVPSSEGGPTASTLRGQVQHVADNHRSPEDVAIEDEDAE
jgi:hypothetical protein